MRVRRASLAALGSTVAVAGVFAASASLAFAVELPDGRQYEIANPAQKLGYPVGGNLLPGNELGVSADGARITYSGTYPLPGSNGGSNAAFFGRRTDAGWDTRSLNPVPGLNQIGIGFSGADATLRGTTPDQRFGIYYDNTTEPNGSLWRVSDDGVRSRIADASTTQFFSLWGDAAGQPWFEGISANGRHVVFASTDALVPGLVSTGNEILYDWTDDGANGGAGTIRVVNRTNTEPLALIDNASASLGGSAVHSAAQASTAVRHAISASGARIFFQTPVPSVSGGRPQGGGPVYAREDGAETIDVADPASGYSPSSQPTLYQFLDASVDGRYAYFWANGDLVSPAPTSGGIYRFDMEARQLIFVADSGSGVPTGLASDDGMRLFYTRSSTTSDVMMYDNGASRLVARGIAPVGGQAGGLGDMLPVGPGLHADGCPSANISRDGNILVFTGEDDNGIAQVFRYDARTDELNNVSRSPIDAAFGDAGSCSTQTFPRNVQAQVMSDDGQFVFFTTSAALVEGDTNRQHDVYQWRDGRVDLITQGTSAEPAVLHGVDASGTNVFFTTTDRLVQHDPDDLYDMYTARIGGGFPVANPLVECRGDTCQGDAPGPPQRGVPGSETFEGAGNPPPGPEVPEFSVRSLSTRQLSRLARTGRTTIRVSVNGPGRVSIAAYAKVRGVNAIVGRARASASRSKTLKLTLRLSMPARLALKRTGRLRLRVVAQFSNAPGSESSVVTLRVGRATKKGR